MVFHVVRARLPVPKKNAIDPCDWLIASLKEKRMHASIVETPCHAHACVNTAGAAQSINSSQPHIGGPPPSVAPLGADAEEVSEDVLGKLEYLHAVIMEALRLHPPTSFAFRQVMEEDHVVHNGLRIPVGTKVYFPLSAIARDRAAWDNPDEFKPHRFLSCKDASQGTDSTIKMMPFGGGRRMYPGRGVAMLHLSYFTANLVREFRWREGEGELAVDLQPHVEFFTVMKRPLRAHLELGRTNKDQNQS